jgi:hypothetical protein
MSLAKYAAPLVEQRKKGWGQNRPDPNYKPYAVGPNQEVLSNLNANRTPPLRNEEDVRAKNSRHPVFFRTRDSLERERRYNSLLNPPVLEAQEYELYQDNPMKQNNVRLQAFSGIHEATELNQTFMSQQNLDLLQDRIRYEVYNRSNGEFVIDRQDDLNLQIIMRSIYLQYATNRPGHIKEQIQELNDLVVQDAVPKILSQIVGYRYYLVDASRNPVPLAHPENLNSAGRKQLPSVTKTFFAM